MAEEKKVEVDSDFNKKSSTGMEPKIAVLISHIGVLLSAGWLSGLIIYLLEKENKFVKFHAMQSLVIGIAEIGAWIVGGILAGITWFIGGLCGFIFWPVALVALLVFRIIIVVKAFSGEYYKFPGFGVWAEKWMGKF